MDAVLRELSVAASGYGVELSRSQLELIRNYLEFLLEHNRKVNLTAENDPRALALRHVADGLAAVPVLKSRLDPAPKILDLGAGGGFIGMAIKIAWPEAEVTLMESLKRKFDFLNLAAAKSGLKGLRVVLHRAGPGRPPESGFDAVVERALAPLPEALALALPLLSADGVFLAYQSDAPDLGEPALEKTVAEFSARLIQLSPYRLPLETKDRYLALFGRDRHADA